MAIILLGVTVSVEGKFQNGFRVLLMAGVVLVCSPSTVRTANGSGCPIHQTILTE